MFEEKYSARNREIATLETDAVTMTADAYQAAYRLAGVANFLRVLDQLPDWNGTDWQHLADVLENASEELSTAAETVERTH